MCVCVSTGRGWVTTARCCSAMKIAQCMPQWGRSFVSSTATARLACVWGRCDGSVTRVIVTHWKQLSPGVLCGTACCQQAMLLTGGSVGQSTPCFFLTAGSPACRMEQRRAAACRCVARVAGSLAALAGTPAVCRQGTSTRLSVVHRGSVCAV